MKKIEIIWREILYQSIERGNRRFTQKELAARFGFSTSTVFQALKPVREMGAARVTARNFVLEDPEKLLYHWASVRVLSKDLIFQGRVKLSPFEIEGLAPPQAVLAGYSAARMILGEAPADYDKVYFYAKSAIPFQSRYEVTSSNPNLFVLHADDFLKDYGQVTTYAQTFTDLWNIPDWYAKEFVNALRFKINELLS